MPITLRLTALFAGIMFFIYIFKFIKRHGIQPSYSILWICFSIFLISVSVFEPVYAWIARMTAMHDARHVIYITMIFFILIHLLYINLKLTQLSEKQQMLISANALLAEENSRLKNRIEASSHSEMLQ